jgi:hypothetical protein
MEKLGVGVVMVNQRKVSRSWPSVDKAGLQSGKLRHGQKPRLGLVAELVPCLDPPRCFSLAQFFLERLEQRILLFGAEFLALLGEVKDVDRLLAFCVDQRDFNVAPQTGQR